MTSKTKVYLGFAISGGNVMTKQLADGLVIFAGPNIKTTFSGFVIYADVSAMKRQKVFFVLEKGRIKEPPSDVSIDESGDIPVFRVRVELTIQEFLDVVNSEWIECRVGELEFRLTPEQGTGLKDFAARLAFDEATVKLKLGQLRIDNEAKRSKSNGRPIALNPKKSDAKKRATHAESLLRIARELEKIDDAPRAIAFYKEIIERFADCLPAKTAKERLKVLQATKKEE